MGIYFRKRRSLFGNLLNINVSRSRKAMLSARGLPDSPVVRELLEWVAELEKRSTKSDPA